LQRDLQHAAVLPFGHLGFTLAAARLARRRVEAAGTLPLVALGVGALLPDMVDKPIGWLVLEWGVGRLWGHTLLFAVLLALVTLALRHRGAARAAPVAAALALGSFAHLALDRMWELPDVLLWPALGLAMPRDDPAAPFEGFHLDAYLLATELMGLALLAWTLADARTAKRRGLRAPQRAPGDAASGTGQTEPGAARDQT
jgi:hypothetical protein